MPTPADAHNASSLIGRTIGGRYAIKATIGSGGMGHVYRATQAPINREVAIKVLRLDLAHQDGVAERFQREAKAASLIQHPNAITIFDFGEDDGILYLTMEFLSGETLRQRLRREPPLEVEQALDMFESMAGALGAAHRVGVVHRDLKPDNIFLAKFDAVGEVVKVLDFGLAKLLDRAADTEGLVTDVNLRLGTPRYMAPEQALGLQPIDSRCDVYALALLLFEMLAQRAPFVGEDGMEVLAQRLRREAPRLSSVAPQKNFSPEMDELLGSMLQRDREKRPLDANVILARLREIRKNGQVYRSADDDQLEPEPPPQKAPPRSSPGIARGSQVSGRSSRPGPGPGSDPGRSAPRQQPEAMMRLDQDDYDVDKPTVVVDPGMGLPGGPAPPPPSAPPRGLDGPTAVVTPGMAVQAAASAGMSHGDGYGTPPISQYGRSPMPASMPSLSGVALPGQDPARSISAPAVANPAPGGKKLMLALIIVALALLAPLLALIIRWMASRGDEHGDAPVKDDVVSTAKPQTPPAETKPGAETKPAGEAATGDPAGEKKGTPAIKKAVPSKQPVKKPPVKTVTKPATPAPKAATTF